MWMQGLQCLVKCISADHAWSTAGRIECSQGLQSRHQFLMFLKRMGSSASKEPFACSSVERLR